MRTNSRSGGCEPSSQAKLTVTTSWPGTPSRVNRPPPPVRHRPVEARLRGELQAQGAGARSDPPHLAAAVACQVGPHRVADAAVERVEDEVPVLIGAGARQAALPSHFVAEARRDQRPDRRPSVGQDDPAAYGPTPRHDQVDRLDVAGRHPENPASGAGADELSTGIAAGDPQSAGGEAAPGTPATPAAGRP